jgi:hypothetical protein
LLGIVSTHGVILREGVNSGLGKFYSMGNPSWDQKPSFSAAC